MEVLKGEDTCCNSSGVFIIERKGAHNNRGVFVIARESARNSSEVFIIAVGCL